MEHDAEESARNEVALKQAKIEYPSWWTNEDGVERGCQEYNKTEVNQAKYKVNKNLQRYAEDSLDARIRHVQQQNQGGETVQSDPVNITQVESGGFAVNRNNRNSQMFQEEEQSQYSSINPKHDKASSVLAQSNIMASIDRNNLFASTNRVEQSRGSASFAYTSGKHVEKYSPVRLANPGQNNVPMSYAGPPNEEELKRNANRHLSGNRNFTTEQAPQKVQHR
jgi:hypothetical protein